MADRADSTREQYERLSSRELHDLAVRRSSSPRPPLLLAPDGGAAGRSGRNRDLREAEVAQMRAHLNDVTDAGRGEVAEQLRPFYIDYLTRKKGWREPARRGSGSGRPIALHAHDCPTA